MQTAEQRSHQNAVGKAGKQSEQLGAAVPPDGKRNDQQQGDSAYQCIDPVHTGGGIQAGGMSQCGGNQLQARNADHDAGHRGRQHGPQARNDESGAQRNSAVDHANQDQSPSAVFSGDHAGYDAQQGGGQVDTQSSRAPQRGRAEGGGRGGQD